MAKGSDVLEMLLPNGGWVISGDSFDSIIYDDGIKPITKKEFEAAFAQFDAWKAERDATRAATKAALLERLGITEDEAKLLLA